MRTTIEGLAVATKAGAVVMSDDGAIVYIRHLDAWPSDLIGQRVLVTGTPISVAVAPEAVVAADGAISQGVAPKSPPVAALDQAVFQAVSPVPRGSWEVIFSDGNGNRTQILGDGMSAQFTYAPVTPETSSSGIYSGGSPAAGGVPPSRLTPLWVWIGSVRSDPAVQTSRREMGTGRLQVTTLSGSTDIVLARGAALGFVSPDKP